MYEYSIKFYMILLQPDVTTTNAMFTLQWRKKLIELEILENESTNDFKNRIEKLTSVPSKRQRILCKKLWKGPLKDGGGDGTFSPGH